MSKLNSGFRLAAFAAALALAACGGGGGGGGAPAPIDVEGAAVKGTMRLADVTLIELAPGSLDPTRGKLLKTGKTDSNGAYKLRVSGYGGGVVIAQVRGAPGATKTTEVICDFDKAETDDDCGPGVKFKQALKVDSNFMLESVLPKLNEKATNQLNATALTTLIRRRAAVETGNNNFDKIFKAASRVNQLAGGVDVARTRPVDLAAAVPVAADAAPDEVAYAALNAAVLSRIDGDIADPQAALSDAVEELATNFADDGIPRSEVRELVAVARTQLPASQQDNAAVTSRLMALETAAAGPDNFLPPASDPANGSAVEQAKAFVANIRTTVQRYDDLPDLDQNAFVQRLDAVGPVSDAKVQELFASLGFALDSAATQLEANPNLTSGTISSQNSAGAAKSATLTFTRSGSTTTAKITGDVGDDTLNLTAVFPTALEGASGTKTYDITVSGTAQTTGLSGVILDIKTSSKAIITTVNASAPIEDNDDTTDGGKNIDKVVLDLNAVLRQKGVDDPVAFEGTIGFTALQCSGSTCATPTSTSVAATPTRILLKGKVSNSGGSLIEGSIEVTVKDASARTFNYDQPYSATNFIDGSVVISAHAKAPNLPEALVTVGFDSEGWHDARELPLGKATVTLNENGKLVLRISSANSATAPDITAVLLEDGNGIKLTLNNIAENPAQDVDLRGDLRVGDKSAGKVEQSSDGLVLIRYADGSFETLFF